MAYPSARVSWAHLGPCGRWWYTGRPGRPGLLVCQARSRAPGEVGCPAQNSLWEGPARATATILLRVGEPRTVCPPRSHRLMSQPPGAGSGPAYQDILRVVGLGGPVWDAPHATIPVAELLTEGSVLRLRVATAVGVMEGDIEEERPAQEEGSWWAGSVPGCSSPAGPAFPNLPLAQGAWACVP